MEMERRDSSSRVAVDSSHSRRIRGDAIVFNSSSKVLFHPSIGHFREIILPSAVDRTLQEAAHVKALWNHNADLVLGSTRAGTLTLRKGRTALGIEIAMPTWADMQMESVSRGDVDGMSFAFHVPDEDGEKWDRRTEDGIPIRYVNDMSFSEVSIVAFPAYAATEVAVSQRSVDVFKAVVQAEGKSIDWYRKVHRTRMAG